MSLAESTPILKPKSTSRLLVAIILQRFYLHRWQGLAIAQPNSSDVAIQLDIHQAKCHLSTVGPHSRGLLFLRMEVPG